MNEWTTRSLLLWTTQRFEQLEMEHPRLRAEMLLSYVLNCDRLKLYMESDRPATPEERERFRELVQRALQYEPIDYLVGHAPFYGMTLTVTPATLIPRPATETLVDLALEKAQSWHDERCRIADVGTGSGAIAIAVARELHRRGMACDMIASDISDTALDVAEKNAHMHGISMTRLKGSLLEPHQGDYHLILSNPPYIPDHEWNEVPPDVRNHEPTSALRGGPDGLDLIRPLVSQAPDKLKPGGWLMIETAACTSHMVAELMQISSLVDISIHKDHEDLPRAVIGQLPLSQEA